MRWLLILVLLFGGQQALWSAGVQETRAFKMAIKPFEDKNYAVAEQWLSEFLQKYPDSEHRPEVILYQAKCLFFQTNYQAGAELLEAEISRAGPLADQYHFWLGESLFERGEYKAAASKYDALIKNYPHSSLMRQACYAQALCFSKLGDWAGVVEVLGKPEGEFQKAAAKNPADAFSINGSLLLAEALHIGKQFERSLQVLRALDEIELSAELRWKQQYLLCRVLLASQKPEQALEVSSNIVGTSNLTLPPRLQAEAVATQAEILEQLGKLPDAVLAYEKNLTEATPSDLKRRALFKTVDLTLLQKQPEAAVSRLEKFAEQNTNDANLDLALFTVAELRLKQLFESGPTNGAASSNQFQLVLTNLTRVIVDFPQSDLVGKAFLNRGWCYWIDGRIESALRDFLEACLRLPLSQDHAIARFKAADAQFRLQDYEAAIGNYNLVLRDYETFEAIKTALFDQALYQIVRAALARGDIDSARDAMAKILEWYPNSGFAERSLLLVGQDLNRKRSPGDARELFSEFVRKAPGSSLLPEVQLAIARTYIQEKKWTDALATLDTWVGAYTNHNLLPHAEFSRALATYQSGQETNALTLFTIFVQRFATNSLAPVAQNWLGDFYFNRDEFATAEEHYQLVKTYNPSPELACQAILGAGRAAFERAANSQDYDQAATYFLELINDTSNTPPQFVAQSYYALGDTRFNQFLAETDKNSLDATNHFDDAIKAFSKIVRDFSTNTIGALALGRRGDCQLQWALLKNDVTRLDLAFADYTNVLANVEIDVGTRAQAEVGVGRILELQGKFDDAWARYARVVYAAEQGEFDPKWVREAGIAAAKLSETRGKWEQAINIYMRLVPIFPSLKPTLDKKIGSARAHLELPQN